MLSHVLEMVILIQNSLYQILVLGKVTICPLCLFSLFFNDLTEFMSHAYSGLNDISNMSHLLFDNNDIEVYFKLYLLLYADDTVTVVFAEIAAGL